MKIRHPFVAVRSSVLQCVAVYCSVLRHITMRYSKGLRHPTWHSISAVCCSVLQCVAVCCSVLQCVAVCCNVLQCVAVCCSVLQCVATDSTKTSNGSLPPYRTMPYRNTLVGNTLLLSFSHTHRNAHENRLALAYSYLHPPTLIQHTHTQTAMLLGTRS